MRKLLHTKKPEDLSRLLTASGQFFKDIENCLDVCNLSSTLYPDNQGSALPQGYKVIFETENQHLYAMAVLWSLVAFENYVIALGTSLATIKNLDTYIVGLDKLTYASLKNSSEKRKQKEKNEIGLSFTQIKKVYRDLKDKNSRTIINKSPISKQHKVQFEDLAIIRHILAHQSGIFLKTDRTRLKFYKVNPNEQITFSPQEAKKIVMFVWKLSWEFRSIVWDGLSKCVIRNMVPNWHKRPPKLVMDMISVFNHCDLILSDDTKLVPPFNTGPYKGSFHEVQSQMTRQERIRRLSSRRMLTKKCIEYMLNQEDPYTV